MWIAMRNANDDRFLVKLRREFDDHIDVIR